MTHLVEKSVQATVRLLAGVVLSAFAVPASASDKQDFVQCDGRVQPGSQDDGMRAEAATPGDSRVVFLRGNGIAACTTALASTRLLPTQTLRRVHLLRARAVGYIESGDGTKALADIDAAEQATSDRAGDRFYQRSMGVSLTLLRAIVAAQAGDMAKAVPLARRAMDARPYSLEVQQAGAAVLQAARPLLVASPSPWESTLRLVPGATASVMLSEAEVGNYARFLTLRSAFTPSWPTPPLPATTFDMRNPQIGKLIEAMLVGLTTGYADAATGDVGAARRELADVRAKVAAAKVAPLEPAKGPTGPDLGAMLNGFIDARAHQIDARIAVAEGRTGDAIASLVAAPLPTDGATVDLVTALKAKVAAKDSALVPDPASFRDALDKQRRRLLANLAPAALIAPETPRSVIDYQKARPNILGAVVGAAFTLGTNLLGGISRTDGFRSTTNADGTVTVEFLGNTPSRPLVQEMTLLRAAEVTRTAGKPAFVIVERRDFTRNFVTKRYGMTVSSVPTGYKTELKIRYLDTPSAPRALGAVAVIDALGPLYYETKTGT